ncbi:hypothetical protein JCM19237_6119 [Photobacterium aphoticum]|uniref:Metallo-beta-lactamase domain-containing protein n=1 Tax=Photobacterium aphoticum TaxID=754436 RepID=A0A090QJX8_9GAMM|nr:hypothetical protein JCM19237_6119 [Photobacterium aphoticum]
MHITQVRNATQLIQYAGKTFLVDPMLAEKAAYPGFPGTVQSHLRFPTVDLPLEMTTLLNIDAVLLTHTHLDHWDEAAVKQIPKDTLVFVQDDHDAQILRSQGFTNLTCFADGVTFEGISLTGTACQHGSDALYQQPELAERLGEVTGVILSHPDEETLYLVGDSIWTPAIEATMKNVQPGVVILNTGWAHVLGFGPIIMGQEDVLKTHQILPQAQIVATHMDAVNHTLVTRQTLREYVAVNVLGEWVHIPEDGETIRL